MGIIELTDNGDTDNKGRLQFSISGSGGTTFITSSELPFYNDEMWSVMLTRKSSSGVDLTIARYSTQDITYELTTKQYDSSRQVVVYQTDSSSISTGMHHNQLPAIMGLLLICILVVDDKFHKTRFSGSMMEFRLWSEPLSQSVFDNHVGDFKIL